MAKNGTRYLKAKYDELAKDFNNLIEKYNNLIERFNSKSKENALYEDVAEDTNALIKHYVKLSQKKSYERTDEDEIERITIAKEMVKPFKQRMREFSELKQEEKKKGVLTRLFEKLDRNESDYNEAQTRRENSENKLFTSSETFKYEICSVPDVKEVPTKTKKSFVRRR